MVDSVNTELVTHFDHGPTALTSNTTLGASHYEQFIQVSGAAVTLTLSDAATLTAGWNCRIVNTDSTNSITIGRATAGDTINGTAANFTLPALHAIDVFVIAAANGFLVRSAVINPVTTDTAQTISGAKTHTAAITMSAAAITMSGASVNFAEGSDVASAATADIWSTTGNTVHVTGTTTITSLGTAPQAGAWRRIIFDGALILTHGANLNLPGAVNKTTAAGDSCIVYADTTTQLDVFDYTSASGQPIVASTQGITKLTSGTVSAATLDIVMTAYTANPNKILVVNFLPATDNVNLLLRTSTDGGTTFGAGAADYDFLVSGDSTTVPGSIVDDIAGASAIQLNVDDGGTTRIGNGSTGRFTGTIHLPATTSAIRQHVRWDATYQTSAGNYATVNGGGRVLAAQDTDAIRLLFSSGNIDGTWALYGWT